MQAARGVRRYQRMPHDQAGSPNALLDTVQPILRLVYRYRAWRRRVARRNWLA